MRSYSYTEFRKITSFVKTDTLDSLEDIVLLAGICIIGLCFVYTTPQPEKRRLSDPRANHRQLYVWRVTVIRRARRTCHVRDGVRLIRRYSNMRLKVRHVMNYNDVETRSQPRTTR